MLSSNGKCKVFDASADGYVRGEGSGGIVLRRYADAVQDLKLDSTGAPPILAVIRGCTLNQDGRSASFTAPSGSAQQELIASSLKKAQLTAGDITFLESHGTGTALGDPIEWEAIRKTLLGE